jgi:replicative superfamily II helicase
LQNPKLLADWVEAKYYVSRYRPVPIEEYLVYENSIYPTANVKGFFRTASQLSSATATEVAPTPCRSILASVHRDLQNPVLNAVVALALETAMSGYGALVFRSSRQGSQSTAVLIAEAMPTQSIPMDVLDKRMDVLASLQALPGSFEPALSQTILQGVGFHHAGLTSEEREIVADAYDQNVLSVMVATCSLAAGINLPARRVILNGARMGRELVGPAMLRQMRGRAGRKGKDEVGESCLCCHKADLEAVAELLEAEMPAVQSCMTAEKRGIKRALLEVIVTRLANSRHMLDDYVRMSLRFQITDHVSIWSMVDEAVQDLLATNLIEATAIGCFEPTTLGQAIVASSLTPEDGIFVHNEMRRALESFVMDGDMHIFYLFTPVQTTTRTDISWPVFRNQMEDLDESSLRALRCIGVSPSLVNSLVNSGTTLKENTPEEMGRARTYRRAFAAFQLRDLCNEMPIHKISARYSVPRGFVQNLALTCHGFAAAMINFCARMGWGMLAAVLEHMVDRLRAGARADLLEMAQVTHVKSRMARILWENGFKSVRALAEAEAKDLVPVMMLAQSSKLRMEGEAREKLMSALKGKAKMVVASANRLCQRQQLLELEE